MTTGCEVEKKWVLQICHGYDGPFLDCARQYAALFASSEYEICTVYLTGKPDDEVIRGSASSEVIFLDLTSKAIRGLKWGAIRCVREIATRHDFAFCLAHRFKPTYIALFATRLPVFGVQHAFGVYRRKSRQLMANLFKKRLVLLNVSCAVRDDVRECLSGWPKERIETLYNRIDFKTVQAAQHDRSSARTLLGLPLDAWIIGNVGRLHADKDQETLIRGFAAAYPQLPLGSRLAIIGTGHLERQLKALVDDLGMTQNVIFCGFIRDAVRYFNAFDVFALTSRSEGFGMVLTEAMAAGVPIIASDSGAGAEVVSGVGMLFQSGSKKSLAQMLIATARLSEEEKICRAKSGYTKLEENFTDTAARKRFYEFLLPLHLN